MPRIVAWWLFPLILIALAVALGACGEDAVDVLPPVAETLERADVMRVRTQLTNLSRAIDMYRMRANRLPQSLEDLTETSNANPVPTLSTIPLDPWGNPYEYLIESRKTYRLQCHGPDGQPDTDDDIWYPEEAGGG